jgi:hypothetical protein
MGKRIDHLSLGIQLVEGLFVKYANVLEHKMPSQKSSDNTVPRLTERYFVSKILPSEKKSRLQRLCVVCQKRGKRMETVYWRDACDGLISSMLKVILKYSGIDIPILCTSLNVMSKLE